MAEKGKLNSAAIDGLVIALIVIVCGLLSSLASAISIVFWVVQLVATVWMLVRFMKKYSARHAAEYGSTKYSQAFSYGFMVSLCSTIVISVFSYLQAKYMVPQETFETAIAAYRSSVPDEEILDRIMDNIPFIMLVSRLVWCTILGTIYSAIIANFCVKTGFEDFGGDAKTDNTIDNTGE